MRTSNATVARKAGGWSSMSSMKIPDRLVGYLEDLAALGYFGKTPGDVARHFIERGIERSVYDGFIEVQDWNARELQPQEEDQPDG